LQLDGNPPTATIAASYSKHRRRDTQVLHPELVAQLKDWLATKNLKQDMPLFPISGRVAGGVERKTSKMIQHDLLISRLLMNLSAGERPANPAGTAAFAVECGSLATSGSIIAARERWWEESRDSDECWQRIQSDLLHYCDHDGLYADFHSCRHLFVSSLSGAFVSPKVAQTLTRHSDNRLTLGVYTHVDLQDQQAAIAALPRPPGPEMQKTNT
jgi:hypothetical protein